MKRNKQAKKKAEELRRLSQGRIVCPKCGKVRKPTRHHILPVFWFGRKNNTQIIKLCADCHQNLEKILWRAENGRTKKLPITMYFEILAKFLAVITILFLMFKFYN
jgi:hypothetical protein